jgi:hypothetical protein
MTCITQIERAHFYPCDNTSKRGTRVQCIVPVLEYSNRLAGARGGETTTLLTYSDGVLGVLLLVQHILLPAIRDRITFCTS